MWFYKLPSVTISGRKTGYIDDIDKYTRLKYLKCSYNKLINLDNLPPTLIELDCSWNELTSLDNLPLSLKKLNCDDNPLTYNFNPTLKNIRNYNTSRKTI